MIRRWWRSLSPTDRARAVTVASFGALAVGALGVGAVLVWVLS